MEKLQFYEKKPIVQILNKTAKLENPLGSIS